MWINVSQKQIMFNKLQMCSWVLVIAVNLKRAKLCQLLKLLFSVASQKWKSPFVNWRYFDIFWNQILTQIFDVVAGSVEGSGVELEADDGEDDDGEEEEQGDVDEGTNGLPDWTHHNLETWKTKREEHL